MKPSALAKLAGVANGLSAAAIRTALASHRSSSSRRVGRRVAGEMNGTEKRYAARLSLLIAEGSVLWFAFEPITILLGERCAYTPDFLVAHATGRITVDEIKGHERDDAVAKWKAAAKLLPIVDFRMIEAAGGGWKITREIGSE